MFRLHNVEKIYRKRQAQVRAFSAKELVIAKGEYVAVVGPSGCGKTTMLSLLGGMLSPDCGQVWLGDKSLYELSVPQRTRLRREQIGFVFQTFNLLPYLTALENVQVPLYLSETPIEQHRHRAAALLDRFGLGDRLDHLPCELSTGQQQRVALARTMANDPQVILADEPTGNLDPDSRAHVLELFDSFVSEGRTIVMVTHAPAAAQRASRRISLRDGKIVTAEDANRRQAA